MKRIVIGFVAIIIVAGAGLFAHKVSAQTITLSQLVELFISVGIISPDKVTAARASVSNVFITPTATSTATSTIPVVTSQKVNETWLVGSKVTISWTQFKGTNATIYLNGGGNYEGYSKVIGSSTISKGYFDYLVTKQDLPVYAENSWGIFVCNGPMISGANNCGKASGNVYVKDDVVTQPTITILSPNGGETMVSGEGDNAGGAFTVTWSANYSSSTPVSGSLIKEDSGKMYTVQIASYLVSGKSSARLALLPSGRYKVLLCAKTICDESDNYFTIKEKIVPPVTSCVDSDGGKNIDVAGLTDGRVNGIGSYFRDSSVGSNGGTCSGESCTSVAEGYCADGKVANYLYQCSSGYSVNGACATKPVAPVSERESTISSFYKTYLGRAGSQSEISYWSDNSLTIDQIKQEFIKSSERKDIVTQMYRDILKREPDAAGLDSLRLADSSIDQIRQAFYNSAEYKALSGGATVMFSIEGLFNLVKALR